MGKIVTNVFPFTSRFVDVSSSKSKLVVDVSPSIYCSFCEQSSNRCYFFLVSFLPLASLLLMIIFFMIKRTKRINIQARKVFWMMMLGMHTISGYSLFPVIA